MAFETSKNYSKSIENMKNISILFSITFMISVYMTQAF